MQPRQKVETVAYNVELLGFMQNRIGMYGYAAFAEYPRRESFRWTASSSENLKG